MLINDRYTIDAQTDFIDSGGFGRVYKANDEHTGKTVALKQFLVNNTHERASLKAELLRAKALAHPNIVKYLDYFETIGQDTIGREITEQWAVMEYIEGGNLTRFIEKETIETRTKLAEQIFTGIIKGLDYLHTRRWDNDKNDWITLIHRDLKPANILLQHQGDKIIPKICDFGLSKEVLESHSGGETTSTAANSTIEYAAPELFNPKLRKNGALQTNYDYWALGIIIYRYFKNTFPFGSREQGNTQEQIMTAILDKEPDLYLIPREWVELVEKCLMKDANKREIGKKLPLSPPPPPTRPDHKPAIKPTLKPLPIIPKRNIEKIVIFIRNILVIVMVAMILFLVFVLIYREIFIDSLKSDMIRAEDTTLAVESTTTIPYDTMARGNTLPKKNQNEEVVVDNTLPENTINKEKVVQNTMPEKIPNAKTFTREELVKLYNNIDEFHEGFARVSKNNQWGFINQKGQLMWDGLEWDNAGIFSEGFACVGRNRKYGFINNQGQLLWGGLEWDYVSDFSQGFGGGRKDNGKNYIWYKIDKYGNVYPWGG